MRSLQRATVVGAVTTHAHVIPATRTLRVDSLLVGTKVRRVEVRVDLPNCLQGFDELLFLIG